MLNTLIKWYYSGRSHLLKARISCVGNPCLNGMSCLGIALTVMNATEQRNIPAGNASRACIKMCLSSLLRKPMDCELWFKVSVLHFLY